MDGKIFYFKNTPPPRIALGDRQKGVNDMTKFIFDLQRFDGTTLYVYGKTLSDSTITNDDISITGVAEKNESKTVDNQTYTISYYEGTLNGATVKIYKNVQDALNMADDSGDTIKLLSNIDGAGLGTYAAATSKTNGLIYHTNSTGSAFYCKPKSFTLDLGGYSYIIDTPAVGSSTTETQAFHMEKARVCW